MASVNQILPASQRDALLIARSLRNGCEQTMGVCGVDARRVLTHAVRETAAPMKWLCDGKLQGIGGIAGPLLSITGLAWVAFTKDAINQPSRLLRFLAPIFADNMLKWNSLETAVHKDDYHAKRFAQYFGFSPTSEADERGMIHYFWGRD